MIPSGICPQGVLDGILIITHVSVIPLRGCFGFFQFGGNTIYLIGIFFTFRTLPFRPAQSIIFLRDIRELSTQSAQGTLFFLVLLQSILNFFREFTDCILLLFQFRIDGLYLLLILHPHRTLLLAFLLEFLVYFLQFPLRLLQVLNLTSIFSDRRYRIFIINLNIQNDLVFLCHILISLIILTETMLLRPRPSRWS